MSKRVSLSQALANVGLTAAAIEAHICIACNWDDEELEYFCRHTDEIPEAQRVIINGIISSELLKRALHAPAIPAEQPAPPTRSTAKRIYPDGSIA